MTAIQGGRLPPVQFQTEQALSMEPHFSLKRWLTLWLFRLRFAGVTFSKKNQVSLKENNWGYLLLIIKSKLSSKNDKFGNLLVWETESLRASHCLALESEIDRVVIRLLSRVWLLATPWTAASQVSLFFTISRSLLKLMSWFGDAIQPSQPLLPPSPAFNLS